tara:strand:- start:2476 stop:2775 length:300 start_codon:yes stop_codon:yes gene_type:complete
MATASKSRAAKNAEATAESVGDDIKALRDDVDKLLGDIAKLARHETQVGVNATKAGADHAIQRGEAALDQSRDYVRENPLAACGAALGVGFVAALLLKR